MTVASSTWRVLVIDDDDDTRANLCDILELDGLEASAAGSIAEAIAHLGHTAADAILLDRQLPDGTAEVALPRLKLLAPDAAVAVVTGYADLDGVIGALRERADDYLIKPVSPEQLRNLLTKFRERQRHEAEKRDARENMLRVERLAAIGQMVAGLAHESRNALQRSQACLEMLALEVAGQSGALDLLKRIQAAQDELHRLFDEIRIYAAPIKLERKPASLDGIWQEAWEMLATERAGRSATLEEPRSCVASARLDRYRMVQVFRNLFENALAACPDPVVIAITCGRVEQAGRSWVRLSIRDNGPGLSPEVRSRILEPFFTTRTRGTGLGLSIAERIVTAHEGTLAVGEPGPPGCEILITLPWPDGV
jgi:signal transduction histidine kinase